MFIGSLEELLVEVEECEKLVDIWISIRETNSFLSETNHCAKPI
ncbi:hypothetical protein EV05_0339 [Prochlorococcus sp. MIT 0601]|nr:hypothetical protein EV05_0339 [Prochlorococcus sp. MIT 0601]